MPSINTTKSQSAPGSAQRCLRREARQRGKNGVPREHRVNRHDRSDHPIPLSFLLLTIPCQCIGFVAAMMVPALPSLLVHGTVAALIARFVGTSFVWQLFNLLLPLAIPVAELVQSTSTGVYVALFVGILCCIYLPTFWTRVPYYPTDRPVFDQVLSLLPTDTPFTYVDLGVGFGPLLRHLARERPNGHFVGVDVSPLPYLVAKVAALPLRNCHIAFRDFWSLDLGSFDFVYTFLSPDPMPRLANNLSKLLGNPTVLISNSFPLPWEPDEVLRGDEGCTQTIYIYRRAPTGG